MLNLADGVCVFLQDFVLFLRDVNDLLEALFKVFSKTEDHILQGISIALTSFQDFLTQIHVFAYAVIDNVLILIMSTLVNAKALLILVGNSTLFLLQLGPTLVFSIFCGVTSLISWAVQMVLDHVSQIGQCIVAFFQSVHYELADIPSSSLLGVLLALLISLIIRFFVFRYLKCIRLTFLWQMTKNLVTNCWLHIPRLKQPSVLKATNGTPPSSKCDDILGLDDHSNRLLRQLEQEREEKLCVVCHDNIKCVIILPCRHFCLCQTCVQVIEETDPSCPLCRRFVIDSIKVYT